MIAFYSQNSKFMPIVCDKFMLLILYLFSSNASKLIEQVFFFEIHENFSEVKINHFFENIHENMKNFLKFLGSID